MLFGALPGSLVFSASFDLYTHLSLVVWPDDAISISQQGSGDRTVSIWVKFASVLSQQTTDAFI